MFASILKQVALGALRTNPRLAWELMQMAKYLERWQLTNDFPPEINVPLPRPDPLPFDNVHTDVIFDLVDAYAGDPVPQPNKLNPLLDRKARLEGSLAAVKSMRGFADELEKEIKAMS